MKILVLGGTKFLGRHLGEAALAAGHEVTMFNRGQRDPSLFPDVKTLIGDRTNDLRALCSGTFDVVYDMSGYKPNEVRGTAEMLAARIERYVFVSTVSVYQESVFASDTISSINENAAVFQAGTEGGEAEAYGPLKAGCEREIASVFGERGLIVRPGLIVGPYDPTFRFNYWISRLAHGGKILAPGRPGRYIQVIDACDLADFLLTVGGKLLSTASAITTATGVPTIYNAAGALNGLTMGGLLEQIGEVVEAHGLTDGWRLVWTADQKLLDHSIEEWTELPLWVAEEGDLGAFYKIDSSAAVAAGLQYRPIRQTIEAICRAHAQLLSPAHQPTSEDGRILPTMNRSLEEALLADFSQP